MNFKLIKKTTATATDENISYDNNSTFFYCFYHLKKYPFLIIFIIIIFIFFIIIFIIIIIVIFIAIAFFSTRTGQKYVSIHPNQYFDDSLKVEAGSSIYSDQGGLWVIVGDCGGLGGLWWLWWIGGDCGDSV